MAAEKRVLGALSYVILMALAVHMILQRRVRLALEKEDEPLIVAGNKILELFRPVKIVYIKEQGPAKRFLPDRFLELERAIQMLGFSMDIFIKPRAP